MVRTVQLWHAQSSRRQPTVSTDWTSVSTDVSINPIVAGPLQVRLRLMGDSDDGELQWEADDDDSCSSWKVVKLEEKPKIKRDPDGKVIFDACLYGCMYTEDTVVASIESIAGSESAVLDVSFLQIFILRQPATERHKLCQYLYILMSLTQNVELLFALRKCTPLYDLGWRPDVRDLLTVFLNWGAPVCLLFDKTQRILWHPTPIHEDKSRISSDNIKLVLHHMESGLSHALQGGEPTLNILFRTFCLLSMEKIFVTTFTRHYLHHCLASLVSYIPDSMWNQNKVWQLSELAITGVEDKIHDLSLLCKKLFILCDRCEKIGIHLAYRIVHQCLQTIAYQAKVDLPELPITVSNIIQLILRNYSTTVEMDIYYFDVMVDLLYSAIVKTPVTQDDRQEVVKYMDYLLNAVRENYKSHDVTAVRQKIQRFSNLLKTQ